MKLERILLILGSTLLFFPLFSQINNVTEMADKDWYHMDIGQDSVPGISTIRVYRELINDKKSNKIIVAILDAGVDINHEDLKDNVWTNIDEIPGNGIDDDKNGYIDDIHGWNFLGNPNGENLEYDTWELTRIYNTLRAEFGSVDSSNIEESDRERYTEYQVITKEFESEKAEAKQMYNTYKNFKNNIDNSITLIKKYSGEKEIDIDLLQRLEINNDTLASKAHDFLIRCYQRGFDQQKTDMLYHSYRIRYEYKLNQDYDSRSIIGDNPNDLEDRNYGNSDVIGPDPFHGTSVAGVIGARRSNKAGIDGIANNVELMVVRAIPAGDERDKDVANAIYYAVDNGAKIINMSFGKPFSPNQAHVEKAIRYAEKNGVLLITGSGNNGANVDINRIFPNKYYLDGSECSTWITVGASSWEPDSMLACNFSNYGKKSVDLMAPGMEIYTLFPGNKTFLSEGTSIAAPMVTGVAALIWSNFPELSAQEVKSVLIESVENYGNKNVILPGTSDVKVFFNELTKSGGILNAYNAFILANKIANP